MNVYVHQNKINGKVYIGITHHDNLNRRWINGKGYFRNKHFSDAITKYGWKNFEHIVLFKDIPKEMACCVERELIRKYKANDKRFGYNITDGGEQFKHSEESKRLMSEHKKGKPLPKFTEEHLQKIKLNHKGGAEKKKVLCVETGIVYESINEASRAVGKTKKIISCCCREVPHYKTAGGYHWRFV